MLDLTPLMFSNAGLGNELNETLAAFSFEIETRLR